MTTYRATALLAEGDICDVHLATGSDGGAYVLKIARSPDDADLLDNEAATLSALWGSAEPGVEEFVKYLPRLVGTVDVRSGREALRANVLAPIEEYVPLDEIVRAYPNGVDPRHMVWMANRILAILAWTHRNGIVHGAVVPTHLLYHPVSHGGILLDWCYATRTKDRSRLQSLAPDYRAYYPPEILDGRPPMPADDTGMLARCMIRVLGGDPETGDIPSSVPEPIAHVLRRMVPHIGAVEFPNSGELREVWSRAAEQAYGKRQYTAFAMPATAKH